MNIPCPRCNDGREHAHSDHWVCPKCNNRGTIYRNDPPKEKDFKEDSSESTNAKLEVENIPKCAKCGYSKTKIDSIGRRRCPNCLPVKARNAHYYGHILAAYTAQARNFKRRR
jgi:hypothetical protein